MVNTPWEPPTYTYVPGSAIPGSHPLYSNISSGGSAVSDESDADSTMPPGATTPMFSPIPFLVRPDSESGDDIRMAMKGIQEIRHADGRNTDEGLMSPLMLGGESSNSSGMFQFPPAPNVRSPTPEPEENISSPTLAGSEASDPGHQPYLGRVDELDTGPLTSTLPAHVNGFKPGLEHQDLGTGAGEGGNMRLHGMSERPMAISSTTTIGLRERPVAGLPRGGLSDRFVSGTTEEEEKKDE